MNENSPDGVAIATMKRYGERYARYAVLDRTNGTMREGTMSLSTYWSLIPNEWELGTAYGDWERGHWWFAGDTPAYQCAPMEIGPECGSPM